MQPKSKGEPALRFINGSVIAAGFRPHPAMKFTQIVGAKVARSCSHWDLLSEDLERKNRPHKRFYIFLQLESQTCEILVQFEV